MTNSGRIAAAGSILIGCILLIYSLGGPVALYYTYVEHHGSIAYHGGDKSWLDGDGCAGGDCHVRVCDNSTFFDAYAVSVRNGNYDRVYDNNGTAPGCGDKRYDNPRGGHKTCEYKGCGAWSLHLIVVKGLVPIIGR